MDSGQKISFASPQAQTYVGNVPGFSNRCSTNQAVPRPDRTVSLMVQFPRIVFKGGKVEKVLNVHFESDNFMYRKNDKFRIRAGGRDCPMGTRRAFVLFFL